MFHRSAIIYQNAARTVTLLDIPLSLALAQVTRCSPGLVSVYSFSGLKEPWPSTDPKSAKAKANLESHGMASKSIVNQEEFLQGALEELYEDWKGSWCLDRKLRSESQEPSLNTLFPKDNRFKRPQRSEPLIFVTPPASPLGYRDLCGWPVQNATSDMLFLPMEIKFNLEDAKQYYHPTSTYYRIPPSSTFILSEIPNNNDWSLTTSFSLGVLSLLSDQSVTTSARAGEFDFVLLDPPWSNRSARRSKSYRTNEDPLGSIKSILSNHIASDGVVACWITNSATARARALEVFEYWRVDIIEEWYWLKITTNGLPVTNLNGIWRKPYETLLIGQKRHPDSLAISSRENNVGRRVIVGVPDVHSQKPCIKELIEEAFGFKEGEYRALEVFARNLTAGWWSWGDECLRFQWEGWWWLDEDGDEKF